MLDGFSLLRLVADVQGELRVHGDVAHVHKSGKNVVVVVVVAFIVAIAVGVVVVVDFLIVMDAPLYFLPKMLQFKN